MEHAVEKFLNDNPATLKEFKERIKEVQEVEQVYLLEDPIEGIIITFMVKEEHVANSIELSSRIGRTLENLSIKRYRIYSFFYAQEELEKGNLYFIKNCGLGDLIYNNSTSKMTLLRQKGEIKRLLEVATSYLESEIDRINSFTEGIKFYRKRKEWAGAAFLIHQKIEWLYRCLETFAMGKPLICHKIANHLAYACPFIYGAGPIFNTARRDDLQLLEVLDRAYTESRYHSVFDVTKREIKLLAERAEMMENQVREIFSFRFQSCQKLLAKEKEKIQEESSQVEVDPSIGDDEEKVFELLKETVAEIVNPLLVISFGKRKGFRERQTIAGFNETTSFTHYDLLVVANDTGGIFPIKISQLITEKSNGGISTTIILTSSKKVEQALQKGNEFMQRVLNSGTVIFTESGPSLDVSAPFKITAESISQKRRDFFKRNHRAKCFLTAADIVSGDDDATEISLQYMALQQICLGAIYVLLGLRPDCLKLEHLLNLCSNFSNVSDNCFPRWSQEDQELFKKLINSPNEVRFRTSDRRSPVDVDILYSRSENFVEAMATIAKNRIEELEAELKNQSNEN
ncbi:hypothetical protein [Salinimicrobium sp. HB62]|uniref:hypothetical protein n=1 Tax=Salinimicrobium sp. HB62 TaxID=3077781 RepID=UPI002D7750C0|nr:hypothetical protein [Salinimicrobium sp. HB62]